MKNEDKNNLPKANFDGELTIAGKSFECAVLEDGTRVISESNFMNGMDMYRSGALNSRRDTDESGAQIPLYLAFKNLKPYINRHLPSVHKELVLQYTTTRGAVAHGIKAEMIPSICEVWMDAREDGVLGDRQLKIAANAELLLRSLAKVGVIALVDEATGYQHDRKHNALRALLDKYIAEGMRAWIHTFPDLFFQELDKLYGNEPTTSRKRPQYYGKFINKYVYEPIESGYVKKELDKLNITDEGKRKARFHQWLSEDGRNVLMSQIWRVQGQMELCRDVQSFHKMMEKQKMISIAPYLFDDMNKLTE